MKYIAILLLFVSTSLSAQDKKEYNSGKMHWLQMDNTGKILTDKPFAKSVTITYDTFLKSYDILCVTDEGFSTMKLVFVSNFSNGKAKYKDSNSKSETVYIVKDNISSDGTLTLVKQDQDTFDKKPLITTFVIADLK